VLIWQGVLDGPGDVARVALPIPRDWHSKAHRPWLRVVAYWDSPVNAAVASLWATRKVSVHLKASPDGPSLQGSRAGHPSYPVIDRSYDLRKLPKNASVEGDIWLLELSYDQIADYHTGMVFTPQQRVAFCAELFDRGHDPVSPQVAIQSLPSAVTMSRLSVPPQSIKTAVVVKALG